MFSTSCYRVHVCQEDREEPGEEEEEGKELGQDETVRLQLLCYLYQVANL